jgi:cold shock CspA family protein/ribosome-associated translation inhibitor RaiA
MQIPLEIQFRNVDRSPTVEAAIREQTAKLEQFAPQIVHCRVTVEAPHKHHHQGNLFAVTIDLTYPGGEIVATRDPSARHAHEDVYVALRDAFKAVRRQLQDRVRVQRGKVKPHEPAPRGRIASIDRDRDCGRIATADGREIYFHRNSVLNADFDRLEPGAEVRFDEEAGDQGPQASSLRVVGKQHARGT